MSVAPTVLAQPRICVLIVDETGLSGSDSSQLQEGLEEVVLQFGEVELVTKVVLNDELNRLDRRALTRCAGDEGCYPGILRPLELDFAFLATIFDDETGEGYSAELSTINLHVVEVVATAEGSLPTVNDALFLLVPTFEVLSAISPGSLEPSADGDRLDRRDDIREEAPARQREDDRRAFTQRERDDTQPAWLRDTAEPANGNDSGTNVLATTLTAGGGVLIGGGLIFWVLADDAQGEIQSTTHSQAEIAELTDAGESRLMIGNVMLVTGLTSLTAGIIFRLTGVGSTNGNTNDDEWLSLELTPGRGGAFLELDVDF